MSPHDITTLTFVIGFKTLTLILGGLITYLAFKAYRRTKERSLAYLSAGFLIVTAGTFLAGVFDQLLSADFLIGLLVESALVAVGFAVIVYSLYTTPE